MDESKLDNNPMPTPAASQTPVTNPAPAPTAPNQASASEPAPAPASEPAPAPAEAAAQPTNDQAIIESYIGNNYQKISSAPFNVAAFFWNFFYLFYRKQYLFGFLAFIITIISVIIGATLGSTTTTTSTGQTTTVSTAIPCTVYLIISLALGFGFNKLYINGARRKIAKLRASTPGISDDEIKGVMKQKGGTSSIALAGSIALFIVTIIITVVVLFVSGAVKFFAESVSNPDNYSVTQDADGTTHISFNSNGQANSQEDVYRGSFMLDSENTWDDIVDVAFPDGFEQDEVLEDLYNYQIGKSFNQTCEAEFELPLNFSGAKGLINAMEEYEPELDSAAEVSDIDTYKANGLIWYYYYSDPSESGNRSYKLATDINDHLVLLDYSADSDYIDECDALLWELVDNVDAK